MTERKGQTDAARVNKILTTSDLVLFGEGNFVVIGDVGLLGFRV